MTSVTTATRLKVILEKSMKAFAMATPPAVAGEPDLRRWVAEAVAFAGSLPEK